MDEKNPAHDLHTEQNKEPTSQNVGDQSQENPETSDSAEHNPDEAFENSIKAFLRAAKAWWIKTDLTKRIEIVIAGVGLLVLIVYTFFSALQGQRRSTFVAGRRGRVGDAGLVAGPSAARCALRSG
jgi:transcriptional regulator of nitric oxide reductase